MFSIKGADIMWQWDIGRKVVCEELPSGAVVCFATKGSSSALVVDPVVGDETTANVPNILLQDGTPITVWAQLEDQAISEEVLPVKKRAKPSDYIYVEDEYRSFDDLVAQLNDLKADLGASKDSADAATASANSAAESANAAADSANSAATSANDAAQSATKAAGSANTAASTANASAQSADTAAESANAASTTANEAASTASAAAQTATDAAGAANDAASNANLAADSVNSSVIAANDAAERAYSAATNATQAADLANSAATSISGLEQSVETAESGRVAAEASRVEAEADRTSQQNENNQNQAKNNADQAANNAAALGMTFVVLYEGQYDPSTLEPTVEGQNGKMYLVPDPDGSEENLYIEWIWIDSDQRFEHIGSTSVSIDPINTDSIDSVASGGSPSGESVLNLTGLSYLWSKISLSFAAISHYHDISQVNGLQSEIDSMQKKPSYTSVEIVKEEWSGLSCIKQVSGVSDDSIVLCSADPSSYTAASESGIYCSAQGEGTLTFSCASVPDDDVTINIEIKEA